MDADIEGCKVKHGKLFDDINAAIFEVDPAEINFKFNTDEYESEVCTILPRLETTTSVEDVQYIVFEEFYKWFGRVALPDAFSSVEYYEFLANKIWLIWFEYKGIQL